MQKWLKLLLILFFALSFISPLVESTFREDLDFRSYIGNSKQLLYDSLGEERVKTAAEYEKTNYIIGLTSMALNFLFLFGFIKLGFSKKIKKFVKTFTKNRFLIVGSFAIIFFGLYTLWGLPLSFYSGFIVEHQYSLSTETIQSWLKDLLLSVAISLPIGLVGIEIVYFVFKKSPEKWWIIATVLNSILLIFSIFLSPLILSPLFNKFTPLPEGELRTSILELSEGAKYPIKSIFVMDSSKRSIKLNAYATGIFGSNRVVLYDTLIEESSLGEIVSVVAHEFGHQKYHHIWIGIIAGSFAYGLGFYLTKLIFNKLKNKFGIKNISDIQGLPLIMLIFMVLSFLVLPIDSMVSRHFERQADRFVLDITNDPDSFIKLELRISDINLYEIDPNPIIEFIFFSHPPTSKRIDMAMEYY